MRRTLTIIYALAAVAGGVPIAGAQVEDEAQVEGHSLETLIVDRSWALRLRAELQFSDDDDELIDQDTSYESFPTKLYSSEAKIFDSKGGADFAVSYSTWENDQGLDARRWSWRLRAPVIRGKCKTSMALKYSLIDDTARRHYFYVSADRSLAKGIYGMLQYRASVDDEDGLTGHQIYEYVSWMPTSRLRVGQQGAVTRNEGSNDLRPGYCDLFTTVFLVPGKTSLRLKARYYDSTADSNYQEYYAYLYQKTTRHSWVRLIYRFYEDNDGRSSNAYGIKARYFFSARGSMHVGYRQYEHSDEADFGTAFVGCEVLL